MLEEIMTFIDWINTNGDTIMITLVALIAGADKIALVFLKTLGNIRDAWEEEFPSETVIEMDDLIELEDFIEEEPKK